MQFGYFLVTYILLCTADNINVDTNWISECQPVCVEELDEWIKIFRHTSDNTNTSSFICPSSDILQSLVICVCDKCDAHNPWIVPDVFMLIWQKFNCTQLHKSINQTTNLCEWVKSHHVNRMFVYFMCFLFDKIFIILLGLLGN